MTRVLLTLLQSAVIRRLREAKCPRLADLAHRAWTEGRPAYFEVAENGVTIEQVPPHLRADFAKANSQAGQRED